MDTLSSDEQRTDCVISGFRREVEGKCALLGSYATSDGNSLPTFRDNLPILPSGTKNRRRKEIGFLTHEDGSDRLSWNVDKELPLLAE